MLLTITYAVTAAYGAFLVALVAWNMRPQARRSRKLRKNIRRYSAKS